MKRIAVQKFWPILTLIATAVWLLPLASLALASERTAVFAVDNMTCALCPLTVEKAMRAVDGVKDVVIDFELKTATVTFEDSKANTEAIAEASLNAGYPASEER